MSLPLYFHDIKQRRNGTGRVEDRQPIPILIFILFISILIPVVYNFSKFLFFKILNFIKNKYNL